MQRTFDFYTLKKLSSTGEELFFQKMTQASPFYSIHELLFDKKERKRSTMNAKQLKNVFSRCTYWDFKKTHIIRTRFTVSMSVKNIPDFDYETLQTFFDAKAFGTTRTQTRYDYICDNPSQIFQVPLVFFHNFDHDNPYVSIAWHGLYEQMMQAEQKLHHPNKRYRDPGDGHGNTSFMKDCMTRYFKNHPNIHESEVLQRYAKEHPYIFDDILAYKELILPEPSVLYSPF